MFKEIESRKVFKVDKEEMDKKYEYKIEKGKNGVVKLEILADESISSKKVAEDMCKENGYILDQYTKANLMPVCLEDGSMEVDYFKLIVVTKRKKVS